LINLLQKDKNTRQIFVATVPKKFNYVDYIAIVTGKSSKHMNALAVYIHKIYKAKRRKHDLIPVIEGKDTNDWIALDLGNSKL
jgi:ribosomal silencing factor RsfS